jgi:hypothetical protein
MNAPLFSTLKTLKKHLFTHERGIRLGVEKTVWKAERAWFLDRRERRAKPGIEQALPRWDKACVFSKHPV